MARTGGGESGRDLLRSRSGESGRDLTTARSGENGQDLDQVQRRLKQSMSKNVKRSRGWHVFQAMTLAGLFLVAVSIYYNFSTLELEEIRASSEIAVDTLFKTRVSAASRGVDVKKSFIYIYDLGPEFTYDVLKLTPHWYSVQYDAEKNLTELFKRSLLYRTIDPEQASLFYIPMFGAWYLNSLYVDHLNNMKDAIQSTSQAWGSLLEKVRQNYPYFNRTNGRDHFGILSMDHGRCTAHTFLHPRAYGEMFFLTLNGDKMVRSSHANRKRGLQALSYNYGVPPVTDVPDIPCYKSDRDIVIPPSVTLPSLVGNSDSNGGGSAAGAQTRARALAQMRARKKVMLFRFSPGQHHGVPISHHGHEIRRELFKLYAGKSIPGWDIQVKGEAETDGDWRTSIFCAAPPGHSQWTSRPMKAILSGCIPVTFFREHDSPWADELDYTRFSLNVDPDELPSLRAHVDAALATPGLVASMQAALLEVQDYFRWSGHLESGVEAVIMRQLWARGQALKKIKNRIRTSAIR